jgi:hypothetical protein
MTEKIHSERNGLQEKKEAYRRIVSSQRMLTGAIPAT